MNTDLLLVVALFGAIAIYVILRLIERALFPDDRLDINNFITVSCYAAKDAVGDSVWLTDLPPIRNEELGVWEPSVGTTTIIHTMEMKDLQLSWNDEPVPVVLHLSVQNR